MPPRVRTRIIKNAAKVLIVCLVFQRLTGDAGGRLPDERGAKAVARRPGNSYIFIGGLNNGKVIRSIR